MDRLIALGRSNALSNEDIGFLAKTIANSGTCLKHKNNLKVADIPSTGGPSSLSTLICPLMLRELGFFVPKLGVPGRPAGGVDVLSQIPGYRIHFSQTELHKCLEKNGYCHFLTNEDFAPLDGQLFHYRKKVDAVNIAPLVIASILSKKVAAGLLITGLDVRVSEKGNFGSTWLSASKNTERFIKVAASLGITAVGLLNSLDSIQQPFIGRGEALVALSNIFEDNADGLLYDHFKRCISMAMELTDTNENPPVDIANRLKEHFVQNLEAQGGTWLNFINKVQAVEKKHINVISTKKSGFLSIDLYQLRDALVWGQDFYKSPNNLFPDTCGVVFNKKNNDLVFKGEPIATYRCEPEILNEFKNKIYSSIAVSDKEVESIGYKIIR
nr:hypothetical protein [uncultured Allomuricauda sp.]